MKPSTVVSMVRSGKARIFSSINGIMKPWYRACFVSAAGQTGLLQLLATDPQSVESIAYQLEIGPGRYPELTAWLDTGVAIGVLKRTEPGYCLRGFLANALAKPAHDDLLAMLIEVTTLHHSLLLDTPARLRDDHLFTLADQDGELIARSSRSAEALVQEAVREFVPKTGGIRLLEIGCGSGTHVRYAASLNPELTALALELQSDVAEMARGNFTEWGLADRVTVDAGDIRDRDSDPAFQWVTLHNNIYYFPVDERVALLKHVLSFLKPSGRLLLTTGCWGGSSMMQVLSLWGAVTEGCGPLPTPDEMVQQMAEAGFEDVISKNLASPVDRFHAFVGTRP